MADASARRRAGGLLAVIGPGVLVAATGVGAGDLATAGFAGQQLGVAIAWAVLAGAIVKLVLTEGLARWQLATGETVIEGIVRRLGPGAWAVLMLYLLFWTWFVGAALMNGCATVLMSTIGDLDLLDGQTFRVYGFGCSLIGLVLVWLGGFKFFERVMAVCIGFMFVAVLVAAVLRLDDPGALLAGLIIPRIPDADGRGLGWTIALAGGVGGTLTLVCYAYWMRECGREDPGDLRSCRIDIGLGYAMTALFGVSMLVIANGLDVQGGGAFLLTQIAQRLGDELGVWAYWMFLIGAFGAIFSSLLGVWQAVPYVFADLWRLRPMKFAQRPEVSTRSIAYRGYLLWIAIAPVGGLYVSFASAQKWYAIVGAYFIPLLGVALLLLNNRRELGRLRNGPIGNGVMGVAAVALIAAAVYGTGSRFEWW